VNDVALSSAPQVNSLDLRPRLSKVAPRQKQLQHSSPTPRQPSSGGWHEDVLTKVMYNLSQKNIWDADNE